MAHPQVRHGFAAGLPRVQDQDVGAHGPQDVQHPDARRVHADVLQGQVRSRGDAGADEKKGGGGDVGGHVQVAAGKAPAPLQADRRPPACDRVAEPGEHALGVVAGRGRLGDAGAALGEEAGQEQAGLDLGAGDRQGVFDTAQPWDGQEAQGGGAAGAGLDARPHEGQGFGDPPHGASAEGLIADQGDRKPLPRQQAAEQPHGGA